jgi:hypothetical protein
VRLAEILVDVVQLPGVGIEGCRPRRLPRQLAVAASGHSCVVIESAIAEHLEVLGRATPVRLRVFLRVDHADALDGLLRSRERGQATFLSYLLISLSAGRPRGRMVLSSPN